MEHSIWANISVRTRYFFRSQNLLLPPSIYPRFQPIYMCDPQIIYPSLPEYSPPPLLTTMIICDPPRINPPLPEYIPLTFQQLLTTFLESTPLSHYLSPSFSTAICDPPRIYPSLPEYTPLFNNYDIMRRSQNLPLLHRMYLPFQRLYVILPEYPPPSPQFSIKFCNIHITLPESTPSSQNIPHHLLTTICDPPRIYLSLPVYKPPF